MPYASEAKSWSDSCRLYKERVRSRRMPDDALVPERYVRNRRETMTHRTPLNLPPENDKAELYRQHTRLDYDKWTRNGWGICELTATAPCPIRGRHASPEKARFTMIGSASIVLSNSYLYVLLCETSPSSFRNISEMQDPIVDGLRCKEKKVLLCQALLGCRRVPCPR